ncbi:MAG: non-ribosomal peptide synthetase, partial [bacterium]|nr:non-ribosomal peptide synthetase [bacterium]
DFFELGGSSLTAALTLTRIREHLGVALAQRSLFETPTVAGVAELVERAAKGHGEQTSVSRRHLSEAPLNAGQEEIWLFSQIWPESAAHNAPFTIRMTGNVDAGALEKALQEIIRRHEVLRTGFVLREGRPVQVIHEDAAFDLREVDVRSLPEIDREAHALEVATSEASKPFDLSCPPMMRATLVRFHDGDCRLYLTLHHIVTDAFSLYAVFVPELEVLYRSAQLEEPSLQYADYVVWQREQLRESDVAGRRAYWEKVLDGATPVRLPTDRARPEAPRYHGGFECFSIPRALRAGLREVGRREGATLFMTLLAAYKVLLWRWSGQDDITVGTVDAGRGRPELEKMLGYFLNQLAVRTDLVDDPPFRALVRNLRESCLAAYEHAHPSLSELFREVPFRTLLVMEPSAPSYDSGWTGSQLDVQTGATPFELALELEEREEGIIGRLIYDADLFTADSVRRLLAQYETLLRSAVSNPESS